MKGSEESEPKETYCEIPTIKIPKPRKAYNSVHVTNKTTKKYQKKTCLTPFSGAKFFENFCDFSVKEEAFNVQKLKESLYFPSAEEIKNDFNLLKAKSDIFKTKNEILSILESGSTTTNDTYDEMYMTMYEPEIERPTNPFFKNLESDEEIDDS